MAEQQFDIIVLGSGPGGYVAAIKAAHLGARVAVVEQGRLGGTCLNNGCIPSKALLATAELMHNISAAKRMGVNVAGEVACDWPAVQKRKDKVLATLRGGIDSLFAARKVTLLVGRGRLAGPGKVLVATANGASESYTADKIILAVGSVPARIPGWPDDPLVVSTTDQALHWKTLPKRLLIVGGGVIGCEFACMMRPLGVEVTVVEMMGHLLPEMDDELGPALQKIFTARGIACHVGAKVADLSAIDGSMRAVLAGGETIDADHVLMAIGRTPATDDIGLETVGLTADRGFVRVDDSMRTAAKNIFCIGDANGRCLLAHAASAQGVVAAQNAVDGEVVRDAPVPWAVYTFPEIAGVGLTQHQAAEQGLPVTIGHFPIGHLGKAMAVGHTEGFVKVIRHRETDALLGVHMLGHNVTEVIGAAGALLGRQAKTTDLAEAIFAHPTIGEALMESAEDALGQAIHLPPRKVVKVVADTLPDQT